MMTKLEIELQGQFAVQVGGAKLYGIDIVIDDARCGPGNTIIYAQVYEFYANQIVPNNDVKFEYTDTNSLSKLAVVNIISVT